MAAPGRATTTAAYSRRLPDNRPDDRNICINLHWHPAEKKSSPVDFHETTKN